MKHRRNINIYCFSGLGADFRIFNQLSIDGAALHPVLWQMPDKTDDMKSFALKLATQIKHDNPVLMGVSFGGMLVCEIAAIIRPQKAIVISSCTHRGQLAPWLRLAGRLKLHHLVPYHLLLHSDRLNRFVFDPKSRAEELYLKRIMLKEQDIQFLKRSVDMIVNWQRKIPVPNILHIHGNADKLIPLPKDGINHTINGGGHFMIWNRAREISAIINQHLSEIN